MALNIVMTAALLCCFTSGSSFKVSSGGSDQSLWTSDGCGKQMIVRNSKVVGGNDTYDGEHPWTVSIRKNDIHHCGGVIIGKRWILTAAHCVQNQAPDNFGVRIGEYHLTKPEFYSKDYRVDRIVIHDNYSGIVKSLTSINRADIALLKISRDIIWTDYARPVCFPVIGQNYANQDAVVVGWGKKHEKSEVFSDILQKAKISVIDNRVCQHWFRLAGRDMNIHDQVICAGYRNGGRDACHGDSGGPLLAKVSERWVVLGVVSTGIGCARPLLPGLYSRVTSYTSWINKYISDE